MLGTSDPATLLVSLARCVFAEVVDDGVGGAAFENGSGLRGLADRLATVRGTVELASRAVAGTRLVARIPVGSNGDTLP